jgi:hypothetical protein
MVDKRSIRNIDERPDIGQVALELYYTEFGRIFGPTWIELDSAQQKKWRHFAITLQNKLQPPNNKDADADDNFMNAPD